MRKTTVLKVLSQLTFVKFVPISNKNLKIAKNFGSSVDRIGTCQSKLWFCNLYFLMSVLTAAVITEYIIIECMYSGRFSSSGTTPDCDAPVSQGASSGNATLSGNDGREQSPPGNGGTGPGTAIVFCLALQWVNMLVINVLLRILVWTCSPSILRLHWMAKTLQEQVKYSRQWSLSLGWSKNEVTYFFLVLLSQTIRGVNLVGSDAAQYLQSNQWSFLHGNSICVGGVKTRTVLLETIDAILFGWAWLMGGPVVNEFLGLVLLSLVTLISRNVKVQPEYERVDGQTLTALTTHGTIFADEIGRDWIAHFDSSASPKVFPRPRLFSIQPISESKIFGNHRAKVVYYISKYFEWYSFWLECSNVVGLAALVIFFNTTIDLCVSLFIVITASIDLGFMNVIALENSAFVILAILKMMCLGNTNQQLRLAYKSVADMIVATENGNQNAKVSTNAENRKCGRDSSRALPETPYLEYEFGIQNKILTNLLGFSKATPMTLSALKFFDVSRETLTTMAGVIITYLMILLQFYLSQSQQPRML